MVLLFKPTFWVTLLASFVVLLILFSKPIHADNFVVNNEYKTGILYTAAIPYYKPALAIPFKVPADGNYKDFEYMLQRSTYIGQSYGFSPITSTPYFDSTTEYPTQKFFEKLKISILPTNIQTVETPSSKPDFAVWGSYGDTSQALGVGGNPTLIEPEIIRDSTRYRWLKFNFDQGVNLTTDYWYWLVMYPDVKDFSLEEWKFVAPKFVSDYAKAEGSTDNFGLVKKWQPNGYWDYTGSGDYLGFRIVSPNPTQTTKTPIVIIPGIGGSEFKASKDIQSSIFPCGGGSAPLFYPKDTMIWVNELEAAATGCDDFFDVLKLKGDGNTPEYPDVVLNGTIYQPSYGKMIQFFKDNGYELNKTLYILPYDWRKDLALTSTTLDNLIRQIKTQTGSSKVDIVAHSMGGLVARNYIKDAGNADNVRKLITLGTPYLGSVEFLKALMYGIWVGANPFGLNLGVNPTEVNDILQNQVGGFELLPSGKYFNFYDGSDGNHPKPFNDQRDMDSNNVVGPLDYYQIKQLLMNLGKNQSLFPPNENFHDLDNNLEKLNGVQTTLVVGSGVDTLGQIKESNKFNFLGIKIAHKDELPVNGDRSVPLFSASLSDSSKNLNLSPNSKLLFVNAKHGDLPNTQSILDLIKNIINNDQTLPNGIQITPFALHGQSVSVHSPVNINAYDSLGNHTGPLPDGTFEENIPGSSYDTLEDSKYIWLPEGGDFTIKLEATNQGSFDLDLRKYADDQNVQTTTYQEVPIAKTSRGEMSIVDGSPTLPQILLDVDGDSMIDKIVDPSSILTGDQITDQNPPVTTINLSGFLGNNNWYKSNVVVALNTFDDNSGVLKTEYSLDGGTSSQVYTAPFTVSEEGLHNLIVKSTDKAGNGEEPRSLSLKIDKTLPDVNIDANPNILWPPNSKYFGVTIGGWSADGISGVLEKSFWVEDEYNQVEPTFTDFGQKILLQSFRKEEDNDGRFYTIKVKVIDLAGNSVEKQTQVLVPHDNSN